MAVSPMTSTSLSVLYGAHIDGRHVQYHAPLKTADAGLPQGAVVHLDENYEFAAGVGTDNVMPILLASAVYEPDITMDIPDPATDVDAWVGMPSVGKCLGLPASGGFEILSTCYVDATYAPNDPLTAAKSGGDKGKLVAGVIGTDMIVGLVSRGVMKNGYGYDALAFWTCPIFPAA